MRAIRPIAAALVAGVAIALPAPATASLPLPVERAAAKSAEFAARLCDKDPHCVSDGVLNCDRQSPRIVLCRIFDERSTRAQGTYRCERMIRVALDAATGRAPVTGIGPWHC